MNQINRLLLSTTSGVLLSFAWLGFPGWTLFFAFLPLLMVEQHFVENKHKFKSISFWGYALLTFLIWNIITTWWIAHATVVGAMLAILANSFIMSVVWLTGHLARRSFNSALGYISLASFWISFEYFHYIWDIEWPWLNIGNGFANDIKMIQWYEYTGTLGGTLWVLLVNFLLFNIIIHFKRNRVTRETLYQITGLILIITIPIIWSHNIYNSYQEQENPLHVVIVQPNIDPYNERYDIEAEKEKLQKFISLAEKHTSRETQLVIGPETLFERWPDWRIGSFEYNSLYSEIHKWISGYPETEVLFGASTHKVFSDAASATSTARHSNGTYFDVYNSAVFIGHDGTNQFYHKSILVPGVEKMPLRHYLSLLNDVVFDLGGTTGSLGIMEAPSNLVLINGVQVAPVICYESVFGGYLAGFIKEGAEIVVVITNDGWWKNTPGYKQHNSFSRLRAIETRRSIARAANTGISCFINQRGDVFQPTPWWQETAISQPVNLNDELTFYVQHGDYLARISIFASVLLLLFLIVKRIIRE